MRLEQSLIVRTIALHLYAVAELALQTCAGYRRQRLMAGLHQYSCPVSMGTRKAVVRRRARVIRDEVSISESEPAPAQPLCISEAAAGTSPPHRQITRCIPHKAFFVIQVCFTKIRKRMAFTRNNQPETLSTMVMKLPDHPPTHTHLP